MIEQVSPNQKITKSLPDRQPLLSVVVGKKGVGKSYTTMQLIRRYVAGAGGFKPRKFLIFDVNDEFADVKSIPLHKVPNFAAQRTPEIRRIRIFFPDRPGKMTLDEMADALNYILNNYHSGGLLVEDISKYTGDAYNRDIIGAICTQRHADVDLIIHYQSIGKMGHPKIWANLNYIRMHRTTDKVDQHRNKFGEFQILKLAECLVDIEFTRGNERFACYIDRDNNKILGAFNKETFEKAILQYIAENEKDSILPILKMKDDVGAKMYSYGEARAIVKEKLFKDYWGNR